jgi:tocopherol O-methyltransferase
VISGGRRVETDDVARHYDDLDEMYREVWGEHIHHGFWTRGDETVHEAVVALVEYLASRLRLRRGMRILDAGCGYGATASLLANWYGADVTGVSLSDRQIAFAKKRFGAVAGLTFVHSDVLGVALPEASLDTIIAIESLAHMGDKPAFFRFCERHLVSGGRVGICAWLAAPRVSAHLRRLLLEPICREGRLPGIGTLEEYVGMAEEAGLEVTHAEDVSRHVRRTWIIIAARVARKLVTDARYRRLLLDPTFESRVFAATVVRLIAAYYWSAMQYGVLVARKP